jgi:phosphoglycolate phosphatase
VSSLPDIADSVNHALETIEHVPPFPVVAFNTLAGNGNVTLATRALRAADLLGPARRDPSMIRAAAADSATGAPIDPSRVTRIVEAKMAYERGPNGHRHCAPFPGIVDMLETLVARGIKLAVLSNKTEFEVRATVTRLFPNVPFVHVAGARDDTPLKPDPYAALVIASEHLRLCPEQVAFVGDTDVDMKTAVNAGMFAVGVEWGFREIDELREHGANVVASRSADITACFL